MSDAKTATDSNAQESPFTTLSGLIKSYCWRRLQVETLITNKSLHIDDLIKEGFLVLAETLRSYDPTKGQLTTYFYPKLQYTIGGRISRIAYEENNRITGEIPEPPTATTPYQIIELLQDVNCLSLVAKGIVALATRDKLTLAQIRQHLLNEGHSAHYIETKIKEVKLFLRNRSKALEIKRKRTDWIRPKKFQRKK